MSQMLVFAERTKAFEHEEDILEGATLRGPGGLEEDIAMEVSSARSTWKREIVRRVLGEGGNGREADTAR